MADHHDTPDAVHDVLAAEEFAMGQADPALHQEPVHDVLAAEEFGMGTADPALHDEPPHDVLAAEEFEVGAGDPALRAGAFDVPASPSVGAGPPRDVLAADAFAVPAGRAGDQAHIVGAAGHPGRRGLLALGVLAVFAAARSLRRRA